MEASERPTRSTEISGADVWAVPVQQHPEASGIDMSDQAEITAPGTTVEDYMGDTAVPQAVEHPARAESQAAEDISPPDAGASAEAAAQRRATKLAQLAKAPPFRPSRDLLRTVHEALPPDIDLTTILTAKQIEMLPDLLGDDTALNISARHGVSNTVVTNRAQQIIQRLARNETTQPYVPQELIPPKEPEPEPIPHFDLPPPPPRPESRDVYAAVTEAKARLTAANDGNPPLWPPGQPRKIIETLSAMGFDVDARLPESKELTRTVVQELIAGASPVEIAKRLDMSPLQVSNNLHIAADVIAATVPHDQLPPDFSPELLIKPVAHPEQLANSLRDRLRQAVDTLAGQGFPLTDVLSAKEQELLPGLLSIESYDAVSRTTTTNKPGVYYHAYNIVEKAERAVAATAEDYQEAPLQELSVLRHRINAAAAIVREHGIDPASLMDDDLKDLFASVNTPLPNDVVQRDTGLEDTAFYQRQVKILRRLIRPESVRAFIPEELDPDSRSKHNRMPAVLTDAIQLTRSKETGGPPGTQRYWEHTQPQSILRQLATRGFDPVQHIPDQLGDIRVAVTLSLQGHSMNDIQHLTGISEYKVQRMMTQAVEVIRHTVPRDLLPADLPKDLFVPRQIK